MCGLRMMSLQSKPLRVLVKVRRHSDPVAVYESSYLLSQVVDPDVGEMRTDTIEGNVLKLETPLSEEHAHVMIFGGL